MSENKKKQPHEAEPAKRPRQTSAKKDDASPKSSAAQKPKADAKPKTAAKPKADAKPRTAAKPKADAKPKPAAKPETATSAQASHQVKSEAAKKTSLRPKTEAAAKSTSASKPSAKSDAPKARTASHSATTAPRPEAKPSPATPRTTEHEVPAPRPRVSASRTSTEMSPKKLLVVLGIMFVAFMGAYNYATSQSTANAAGIPYDSTGGAAAAAAGGGCGMSGGSGGGGCCGGGGEPVEGSTTVAGEVQTIDVDTSQGSFNPNVIKAKAGVPIEMNFSQAPGGCLSGVYFPDFDIQEDLTGGPKTVKLPALEPGEYSFYCQMQMVSATIVVE